MAYSSIFLDGHLISLPILDKEEIDRFKNNHIEIDKFFLNYSNYSLLQNPFRRFPYYTASNINGNLFKQISRNEIFANGRDNWRKDDRIPVEFQLGNELYSSAKSHFDKGHLTKREDVQWGENLELAKEGAASTFYFTNAVPQIDRLNRGIWRRIEDYILHHKVVKNKMKISMFTGPILLDSDPKFVTKVNDELIRLPYLFYKIVYYLRNNKLHRTGFLTSQKGLLERRRIVKSAMRSETISTDVFLDFKDAETYQVRVDFIEKIGGLIFAKALEVFIEDTPEELIISSVNVRSDVLFDMTKANTNLIL